MQDPHMTQSTEIEKMRVNSTEPIHENMEVQVENKMNK